MQITQNKTVLKRLIENRVKQKAQAIIEEKIFSTPIDSGYAVSNWQVSLHAPATETVELRDPTASVALKNAYNVIDQYVLGDAIYISNNVPYIQRILL